MVVEVDSEKLPYPFPFVLLISIVYPLFQSRTLSPSECAVNHLMRRKEQGILLLHTARGLFSSLSHYLVVTSGCFSFRRMLSESSMRRPSSVMSRHRGPVHMLSSSPLAFANPSTAMSMKGTMYISAG